MDEIPKLIQPIVEKRAYITFKKYRKWLIRWASNEDIKQFIFERLYRDNLWNCQDTSLIFVVAKIASIDFLRQNINGFRRSGKNKKLIILEERMEYGNKYFESIYTDKEYNCIARFERRMEIYLQKTILSQLIEKLPYMHKKIIQSLLNGSSQREIADNLNLTEGRISQIRQEIIQSLILLSKR